MHARAAMGRWAGFFVVGCFLALGTWIWPEPPVQADGGKEPSASPKLAVLIVIDQLRGDYPDRWRELFGPDGFNRIRREGVMFTQCHYPYANTVTGAGHASVTTGCPPRVHGVIGNEWYDRAQAKSVYCASTERPMRVPLSREGAKKSRGYGSPERLLAPTLADELKRHTQGRGRVAAFSMKDRGAILAGGQKADVVYWFDEAEGDFITSTFYREELHPWVKALNDSRRVDFWFGKDWTRLRDDVDYARHSGPDEVAEEATGYGQGRTFPHPMTGELPKPGKAYYAALYNSPFANELLLELAKKAILEEQLGRRSDPDFLAISFSANDPIGHCWGPDSQEVLDVTLRTDLLLADLFRFLDEHVGRGNYVLALTSDHGVCPLPEMARRQGQGEAGRISLSEIRKAAEVHLRQVFGGTEKSRWIESVENYDFYLHHRLIQSSGLDQVKVQSELANFLKSQPHVVATYTAAEMKDGDAPLGDPYFAKVLESFHPERSGDVMVVCQPYFFASSRLTGTTHGSPHPYDTHVPLMLLGGNFQAQIRSDPTTPLAASVILAQALGIPFPSATEKIPVNLFQPAK